MLLWQNAFMQLTILIGDILVEEYFLDWLEDCVKQGRCILSQHVEEIGPLGMKIILLMCSRTFRLILIWVQHHILMDHKLHPYHVELHQALSEINFDHRLNCCYWLRAMVEEDPNFLSRVLWTDEASFSSNGGVNLHNMHYWSPNNPHWMREVDYQNRWSLNVWCGILDGRIVGPFFFNEHLNGDNYLNFLANQLPHLLDNIPLQTRMNVVSTWWVSCTLFSNGALVLGWNIPKPLDRTRQFVSMATKIPRSDCGWLLLAGHGKRYCISNSSHDCWKHDATYLWCWIESVAVCHIKYNAE